MPHLIRPLTPAQARVAALVAKGYSYATIAQRLHLSRETVRTHIRAIANLIDKYDPNVSYYNAVLLWVHRGEQRVA
jgi:DNA-binding NarL/FixJ family response regulator